MPRRFVLLVVLAGLAGCGGEQKRPPDPAAVKLNISAPPDTATVRDSTVTLQGTVQPTRAAVEVRGKSTKVRGGQFSTTVSLDEGLNVIDVAATIFPAHWDPKLRIPRGQVVAAASIVSPKY